MANVNTVSVSGNTVADPELRETNNGTKVCNLRIANNRSRKDPEGDGYIEEVSYFDVTVWSGFGELVDKKIRKGDLINVQGRLQQRRWDAEDGTKRSAVSIIAEQIDGAAMFRKEEEVPARQPVEDNGAPGDPQAELKTAEGDDGIPF